MTFGDFEPEDAWHPDDPRAELVANLWQRIALLDGLPAYRVRTIDELDEIAGRLDAWRAGRQDRTARQEERARQLLEDIGWVRAI